MMKSAPERGIEQAMKPHVLLTAIGTRAAPTRYRLGASGREVEASLSPAALVLLLDEKPDHLVALVTEEARRCAMEHLVPTLTELGIEWCFVDIPVGDTAEELFEILERTAEKIEPGTRLTLDLTQGLRHIPFLSYALAGYLTALRQVAVEGAWYGCLGGGRAPDEPVSILDLRPLLELPEWALAVRAFKERGSTGGLSALTKKSKARASLDDYAFAFESALPIEMGLAATGLDRALDLPDFFSTGLPLRDALVSFIREKASSQRLADKGKESLRLSSAELERQAGLIDGYVERKQWPNALGLMREWIVSAVVLRTGGDAERWLDKSVRARAEGFLNLIGPSKDEPPFALSNEQRTLAEAWKCVASARNNFHHHGMTRGMVTVPKNIERQWFAVRDVLLSELNLAILRGSGGRLLVTPLGQSPGVLFSAIRVAVPERVLVITSKDSGSGVELVRERLGAGAPEIDVEEMSDPHKGIEDLQSIPRNTRSKLLSHDEVVVNLTGGTTMMGIVVQQIFEEAARLLRHARRFVLVDHRSVEEQRDDPWQVGEIVWVDEDSGELGR